MRYSFDFEEFHNSGAIVINRVSKVDHIKRKTTVATILYREIGLQRATDLAIMTVSELTISEESAQKFKEAKQMIKELVEDIQKIKSDGL